MKARATSPHVSQRVVRDPRILGGEPTVEGTRVPVRPIVLAHRYYGDAEQVCRVHPMLDQAAVDDALAFYAANAEEIDRYIAENDAEDA
jgi:uncharacterized protein (DUF433 family)